MGMGMDSLTTDADHRDRRMTTFLTHFSIFIYLFKFKPFRDHGQVREVLPVIEAIR